jgi:hypothetical protein
MATLVFSFPKEILCTFYTGFFNKKKGGRGEGGGGGCYSVKFHPVHEKLLKINL